MVLGLVLVWLAGTIGAADAGIRGWSGRSPSLPGGFLLAGANAGLRDGWVPVLIVVGHRSDRRDHGGPRPPRGPGTGSGRSLFFIAVGGIYFTVPDTELMRAVVGVALPLVLLAWPYAAASLGAGGAYAAVGLLLWIAPIEGIGRPGAIVGVVGAFALLVGEPLGRALVPRLEAGCGSTGSRSAIPVRWSSAPRCVLTLYAARVAGMAQTAFAAVLLMIPAVAVGVAFGVFLVLPERRRRRARRRPSPSPGASPAPRPPGASPERERRAEAPLKRSRRQPPLTRRPARPAITETTRSTSAGASER